MVVLKDQRRVWRGFIVTSAHAHPQCAVREKLSHSRMYCRAQRSTGVIVATERCKRDCNGLRPATRRARPRLSPIGGPIQPRIAASSGGGSPTAA